MHEFLFSGRKSSFRFLAGALAGLQMSSVRSCNSRWWTPSRAEDDSPVARHDAKAWWPRDEKGLDLQVLIGS